MTKTSIGVQELRKRIGEKAKADAQHRFWGLYTHVWKLDVLAEAYRLAERGLRGGHFARPRGTTLVARRGVRDRGIVGHAAAPSLPFWAGGSSGSFQRL